MNNNIRKNQHHFISIIVPIYNVEKYIHQCVNSVLNQTYRNFQLILIDDGSPDSCPNICDEYALKDKRIKVIHKENGGLSDARNFGIKEATGDYLLFLDSDDYWNDDDFLLNISKTIITVKEVDVINFGFIKYFPLSEQYIPEKRNFSLFKEISETNREYIRKLLENDLFFEKGLRSEDMAWCGNILYLMPLMTCINTQPYVYRQERADSITGTVDVSHLNDIIGMIEIALKKSNHLNPQDRYYYLSFYAVQYLTLLFNLKVSKGKDALNLSSEVYGFRSILKNDLNPKVKKANKFMEIFGYKIMSIVLRLYVLNTKK